MSRTIPTPVRTRRTRLRPEARREHLLDVAGEILLGAGFDALTMEAVAQRAGVSKGLGYAYFENAEDLALALHEREVEAVCRRVEEAMQGRDCFDERFRRGLAAYLDVVQERGALFAILELHLGRSRRTRERRRAGTFLSFWEEQLGAALPLEPVTARALAGVVLSSTDLFARSWLTGRLSRADAERLCAVFVLAGLHGAAAGGRS